MKYIGPNISFIFTKIKELMNSHNTNSSAHSELFNSWTLLRDPTNAEIADALAVTHKNGIGDVLVQVANTQTFALEDMKLFFRPARFQQTFATESRYEGIYITMDGTQGRYVAKTFADSEIMTPEGPSTISTPSELALYPAASDAVLYTPQTLTEEQKSQARTNIGAGQPDWNQNDSTQPDYVKNRPFYTGDPVETVLVEERTVTFDETDGLYMVQFPSTFEATVGETYKVSWDGTAYECTCVKFKNDTAIGNLSIVGAGSDTGEPFLMGVRNGKAIQIVTQNTSASHTFSISGFTQEVVKIDAKYLPNTVATKSEVEAAQTTANAAQSTAENAQTTAENAQTTAENAQSTAENAQSTANAALERTVEPYTRSIQMAPLYKNGGFSAWRGVVQEIGYNKTQGYFFADAFDTTALKEEDMPKDVFCVNVHVGSQSATAFLTKVVSGDGNDLWSVIGFAVITDGYYRTGEVLYVSSNAISRNETKGLFLTFRAPNSMLLKSSTANSAKQFRITVDDSGVPTITDASDSTNTWKPTNLPTVTSSDSGKFLRVSDTGEWVAETILSATVSNNTLIIAETILSATVSNNTLIIR